MSSSTVTRFQNANDYAKHFLDLLSKEMKESEHVPIKIDVQINWQKSDNCVAIFTLSSGKSNINMDDHLKIEDLKSNWQGTGTVTIVDGNQIKVTMDDNVKPDKENAIFQITKVFDPTVFKRMNFAVQSIKELGCGMNENVREMIFGNINETANTIIHSENFKNESNLNDGQVAAIQYALGHRLSLIQGPPGTGKTEMAASLVKELIRIRNQKCNRINERTKVLVCASSNVAVDNIAIKLKQKNLNVVRVYSKQLESEKMPASFIGLLELIKTDKIPKTKKAKSEQPKPYFQEPKKRMDESDMAFKKKREAVLLKKKDNY